MISFPETRHQVPKLNTYVKHQPTLSRQQTTAIKTHDPLRRISASAQKDASFYYESFQPPPTKSLSESNLAVLPKQKSVDIERSRSLETDLDTVSAQGRYEPTIGARNLQMDDVIVHGRWDLRERLRKCGYISLISTFN